MQQERMFASLTAGFGLLALALACVGIYGIMAYTVSQRTNEIGIRFVLGATGSQIRAMVLQEAGWLATAGVVVGLGVAIILMRLVQSMLYGLKPSDPLSLTVSALLLLAVALLAGWIPTSFMAPRANAFQLRFRFIVRDLYLKEETGQRTFTSREQCSEDSRHSRT